MMTDSKGSLSKLWPVGGLVSGGSPEESSLSYNIQRNSLKLLNNGLNVTEACCAILFNDVDINMGDKRLNNVTALTYNSKSCNAIFDLIEKALNPSDNPWKTILKAILLLHTITLYGPEIAIDRAISACRQMLL